MKKAKKKLLKLNRLESKAWKVFSRFIRLRDCLFTTHTQSEGRCISCNEIRPISEAHAGHFIPRGVKSPQNVNFQCPFCNHYLSGNLAKYLIGLEKKYGREKVDWLMEEERKWKAGETHALKRYQLEGLVVYYTNLIKQYETITIRDGDVPVFPDL